MKRSTLYDILGMRKKRLLKVCKLANNRFDGSVKISEGTFCLKMVHSTAISGQTFLILMLDEFSQRRKMHLQ